MIDQTPSKTEIFNIVQAQSETLDEVSRKLIKIEKLTAKQESRNFNIIIAVLIAAILIVATVAIQVFLSEKGDRERNDNLLEKVSETKEGQIKVEMEQSQLKDSFDNLKAKNPYLR